MPKSNIQRLSLMYRNWVRYTRKISDIQGTTNCTENKPTILRLSKGFGGIVRPYSIQLCTHTVGMIGSNCTVVMVLVDGFVAEYK